MLIFHMHINKWPKTINSPSLSYCNILNLNILTSLTIKINFQNLTFILFSFLIKSLFPLSIIKAKPKPIQLVLRNFTRASTDFSGAVAQNSSLRNGKLNLLTPKYCSPTSLQV